ncbi:glucoamylase family protein [Paucibacter sp. JuS9]|uniref:GH36-type glycosyl hydrolase domain-containing protein n=1 Tax=Paucibacter sp. JuS9 TaxID=3228748 RepID=UPI003757D229
MNASAALHRWPDEDARELLDTARGPLLPALRAEIFGPQRFAEHGRSLGLSHRSAHCAGSGRSFFPSLRSNIDSLRASQRYIANIAAQGGDISPAAEWLLDNFHLIDAQLKEVREGLPRGYYRELPVLTTPPLAGLPRVYGVAWAFVAHTDGQFDEELLVKFLAAYQENCPLDLGEMWALPTTLRVVLIENLRRLSERLACDKAARELADLCADQALHCSQSRLDSLLKRLRARGVATAFLTQLALRLREQQAPAAQRLMAWLQATDAGIVPGAPWVAPTADNLSVGNAVGSLRAIGDADWTDIVARGSALVRLMLSSPLFRAEHALTRDQTLHGIEQLARRSGRSELVVARQLLALMAASPQTSLAPAAACFWLQGEGRPTLMHALGLHERGRQVLKAGLHRAALPLYLGSIFAATALLSAALLPTGASALAWLLVALPASEAVIALVHRLISESLSPTQLPRLALVEGLCPEHQVMVVVPALLGDMASSRALARRLELHYLANREACAQFALLSDWPDADQADAPLDGWMLHEAQTAIADLNTRYPTAAESPRRFLLLHRRREFSESEQRWIGWERKRGKLEQLIARLAGEGEPEDFVELGELSRQAEGTRYLLTLDSDTGLPPGRLRELVGVAAHPYNEPRLAADGRSLVSGYAILQPRIAAPLPPRGQRSAFYRLFAGRGGSDPYSAASSEVYQDLFGEGSFSGKGLLQVQVLHKLLAGRLPEGQVLSHDLLEGALSRAAALSELTLIEEAPQHPDVAAARQHRWMRGDWQLLPFLGLRMRAVNRWKLVDNLRRSLLAPVSMLLLLLALSGQLMSPWVALMLVLVAQSAGTLLGALTGLASQREDLARWHFYRQALIDLVRAFAAGLWLMWQLVEQVTGALDAIVRALYRLLVSRRHLLQWTTSAAVQAAAEPRLQPLLRRHAPGMYLSLGLFAGLLMVDTPVPGLSLALCLAWSLAPLGIWWAGRPERLAAELSGAQREELERMARDTWRFFERSVGPDDRHLPPDNLQLLPHEALAHRTSPTNVGLYLLSAACACEFGWIARRELVERLTATLDSLATLQRHRGHFLNWYDTQSGLALAPHYVSSVDSGNLSGHLLCVAEACLDFALRSEAGHEPAGIAHGLRALAARCQQLAWEPDYAFLYHAKRHLLHIGYRLTEQELDTGLYDLLASESRLTSLLAIAKGDVPVRHWAALGRPFFARGGRAGLRSWSGSMFEYLMPSLMLAEPPGSVLDQAGRVALREQMDFGAAHGLPWGMSESAYAGRDHTLAYQYAPQGVPRLALRRTPPDELVVAPYATALAAMLDPRAALRNFAALAALGARGGMGFIEALDFTPARLLGHERVMPVATLMAHHQGMSLVALTQVLRAGIVQRWGMACAPIAAVASLLHERAPREISRLHVLPPPALAGSLPRRAAALMQELRPGQAAIEPTHLLGNGRYTVALRPNGAGWSQWREWGLSRWRDDALRDEHGHFFFLRRGAGARLVSLSQHPAPDAEAEYGAQFHADRVCLNARWSDLHSRVSVWVSPEDDIEFRQVELRNLGNEPLELELCSAFEPTLSTPRADEAHPAFVQLFMRAQWLAAQQALRLERRPRLPEEAALQLVHFLADSEPPCKVLLLQVDRQQWLGRNRAACEPLGALQAAPVEGLVELTTGLDPVCVLAVRLRIAPGAKAVLTFATAVSDQATVLEAVLDKYRQPSQLQRSALMSATLTSVRLHELGLSPENFAALQTLNTAMLLTLARPDAPAEAGCDRRSLWRFGISGERPLLLVTAHAIQGLGLLRTLAQALRWWSFAGVGCDLVVLNAETSSYQMALQHELAGLAERHAAAAAGNAGDSRRCGFHLLRSDELSAIELATLQVLARVRWQADGRPLHQQVLVLATARERERELRGEMSITPLEVASTDAQPVPAPQGHFVDGGSEFAFEVSAQLRPARPWINVIANARFGCQVSEAGGGYSWAINSRLHQLTAWSNDAVADPPAEWWLVQDLVTREAWSLSSSAWGGDGQRYDVSHGQGWSSIEHKRGTLAVSMTICVDAKMALKQVHIELFNNGPRPRSLRLLGLAEWLMGAQRSDRASVSCAMQRQRLAHGSVTALQATQRECATGFGDATAFLALVLDAEAQAPDWSCDRRELFDARGRLVLPDHLAQRAGTGLDPCALLATELVLAPGGRCERVFLLGHAESPSAARQLAAEAAMVKPAERAAAARGAWDRLLGAATVTTPDPLFDALVNRWLLYQVQSCRLWAKAGFYQAGGASGFRDQLQDVLALAWAAPERLRAQLLASGSRQFAAGDVQHWWHEPGGAGVRTRCSDDRLWLVHACLHYLRATGDQAVMDEELPFLLGREVPAEAEDVYEAPSSDGGAGTLYEHAARALDASLASGVHGLPLMGSGDWNDGMNRVGVAGRGESVWLAWFLCRLVEDFAPLARARGEFDRARNWERVAHGWRTALQGHAWDGHWYRRAFFDDGSVLGTEQGSEARIDLIAQAWSVLSGVASPARQQQALRAMQAELVDPVAGLIRLLDPPLQTQQPDAGYIQAYPPGVRENGGQYSHAGVWALMAQAAGGVDDEQETVGDRVYRYFRYLSPAHRAADAQMGRVYGLEPYAVAGDVYSQPPYVGRGGWSWYTGAAAWLQRAAIESMFGLRLSATELSLQPCLPASWQRAELCLQREGREMRFILVRGPVGEILALEPRARLLPRGQVLLWTELPALSSFVVPLSG